MPAPALFAAVPGLSAGGAGGEKIVAPLVGLTAGVPVSSFRLSHAAGAGFDVDRAVFVLKGGISGRRWNEEVAARTGRLLRDGGTLSPGVGLGGLIRFQGGLSNAGYQGAPEVRHLPDRGQRPPFSPARSMRGSLP